MLQCWSDQVTNIVIIVFIKLFDKYSISYLEYVCSIDMAVIIELTEYQVPLLRLLCSHQFERFEKTIQ